MKTGIVLPPTTSALVDSDGYITQQWYQALLTLYTRTGSAAGISSAAVQSTANTASSNATTANLAAGNAQGTADNAQGTAANAQTTANLAYELAELLQVSAQLTADTVVPISFFFAGTPQTAVCIPIVQALVLPANFAGFALYCGSSASTAVAFELDMIRGGTTTEIGTLSLTVGDPTSGAVSGSAAVTLQQGDVLSLYPIGSPDVTLANIGVTFACSLG